MQFTVLLDAPATPAKRIQIARLGTFSDPRYGDFDITAQNVANWQKHLSKLPGGEALIDFEHRSERKPRDSKAAGWISGIDLDGNKVMADARWTPGGEKAIQEEEYRFLSPVFGPTQVESETLDDALPSVALTNKPFLASMPAVMLASQERVSEAIDEDPALRFHTRALDGEYGEHTQALVLLDVSAAEREKAQDAGHSLPDKSYPITNVKQLKAAAVLAASKHGNYKAAQKLIRRRANDLGVDVSSLPGFGPASLDSRAPMDAPALLTALGIQEDSELAESLKGLELDAEQERTLLDAAQGLAEKASKPEPVKPEPKQLEQLASEQGMLLLDAAEVSTLRQGAAAGELARKQLHQQRFDTAFESALADPKGARVIPEERERLQKFFELDADETLAMISDRAPLVPAKPRGGPTIDLTELDESDPREVAAAGLHPDAHQLDQKIRKHLLDNKLPEADYRKVLEQVMSGAVVL